jgi:hypothetical protein
VILQAVPDLRRFHDDQEFRTELQLAEPFTVSLSQTAVDGTAGGVGLTIHAPKVLLSTYRRAKETFGRGEPCFETSMSLTQELYVNLAGQTTSSRQVEVRWGDNPQITGTASFSSGYEPVDPQLDPDPVVRAFADAWTTWTESMDARTDVSDLGPGDRRLRLESLPVRGDRIWLQFEPLRAESSGDNPVKAGR